MDRTEKTIITITLIAIILYITLITGCQTPYSDYGFRPNDLDSLANANECVTDGFDWLCRGPVQYITVEKVRTIIETKTETITITETETITVEIPVERIIREIYLVKIAPETVIQTPVGEIATDTDGNIITAPEDVDILPYEPPPVMTPPTPQDDIEPEPDPIPEPEPKPIPQPEPDTKPIPEPEPDNKPVTEPEPQPEPEPEPDNKPVTEPEPEPIQKPTEIAYLHQNERGFWFVGFIHVDYIARNGNRLTFLGADKTHDATDKTITIHDYRYLYGDYDPHDIASQLFATVQD